MAMETIYIDRLFLINLLIDYLLCLASARLCGCTLHRARYAAAALSGAAYASLSLLPAFEFLSLLPIKLCAAAAMVLISFYDEEKLMRCGVVFMMISAFFGGAVWALGFGSSRLYIPLSFPALILSFGICYAALSLALRRSAKNAARSVSNAEIGIKGTAVKCRVLLDTGNGLYDPITQKKVMVCSAALLSPVMGDDICASAVDTVERYPGVFRLIPYNAIGTESGMLAAFTPDSISIDGRQRRDIVLAISPQFTGGDGFDAILEE